MKGKDKMFSFSFITVSFKKGANFLTTRLSVNFVLNLKVPSYENLRNELYAPFKEMLLGYSKSIICAQKNLHLTHPYTKFFLQTNAQHTRVPTLFWQARTTT